MWGVDFVAGVDVELYAEGVHLAVLDGWIWAKCGTAAPAVAQEAPRDGVGEGAVVVYGGFGCELEGAVEVVFDVKAAAFAAEVVA